MTETAPHTVPPIASSLTSQQIEERVAEWSALMRDAEAAVAIGGGAMATFVSSPAMAARVADLAAREQQCCPFFGFRVEIDADGLVLEVTAPGEGSSLARHLLGV